jgi:glutamyl-tRNA synthetase
LGHAQTFKIAEARARDRDGKLIFRLEDLDPNRCKQKFKNAAIEDLKSIGIQWDLGPEQKNPLKPYEQSKRYPHYQNTFNQFKKKNLIYPCTLSRKQIDQLKIRKNKFGEAIINREISKKYFNKNTIPNWRFNTNPKTEVRFKDIRLGIKSAETQRDFGDFVIWNRDNIPAYEFAVVLDDIDMNITEVVRGEDLLDSTFRQLLIYKALFIKPPDFYHCPLVLNESGKKLAKSENAISIRECPEKTTIHLKQLNLNTFL